MTFKDTFISIRLETKLTAEGLNIINESFGDEDSKSQLSQSDFDFKQYNDWYKGLYIYLSDYFKMVVSKKHFPIVAKNSYVTYIHHFEQMDKGVLVQIKAVKCT